jgi:hypothetical protein
MWRLIYFTALILFAHIGTLRAEALVAPNFPSPLPWATCDQTTSKSDNGQAQTEVTTLCHKQGGANDNIYVRKASGLPATVGAREFLTNLMLGAQSQCERMVATRPELFNENTVVVSYGRIYCGKLKMADAGLIQSIKVLQGKQKMYAVVRQWLVKPFDFNPPPTMTDQFASKLFDSSSESAQWLGEAKATYDHLTKAVTLCYEEGGKTCPAE